MNPSIVRQRNRLETGKRYNTLISTSAVPEIFRKVKPKKTTVSPERNAETRRKRLVVLGLISGILGLIVICLIFYETELIYEKNYRITNEVNMVRAFVLFLSLMHAAVILKTHVEKMPVKKNKLSDTVKCIWNDKKQRNLLVIELFISMILTPPGAPFIATFFQISNYTRLSSTDIIFPFCILRTYFFITFISNYSSFNNKRSKTLLSMMNCNNHVRFAVKSFVYRMPFQAILIVFIFTLLVFSSNVRVFEKSVSNTSLWDEIWLTFITETTIGYGDYYPSTHIGRLICGFASILGIFVFSYNVMTVKESTDLSKAELQMARLIKHNKIASSSLLPKVIILIQKWWRSRKSKKVTLIFAVSKEANKFKYIRKRLNVDLSISFEGQIKDSEKAIGKQFAAVFTVFENANFVLAKSEILLRTQIGNSSKLKSLAYKLDDSSDNEAMAKSVKSLTPGVNIMKKRSEAVKKLFIRKVAPSLNSSQVSPAFSLVDLD